MVSTQETGKHQMGMVLKCLIPVDFALCMKLNQMEPTIPVQNKLCYASGNGDHPLKDYDWLGKLKRAEVESCDFVPFLSIPGCWLWSIMYHFSCCLPRSRLGGKHELRAQGRTNGDSWHSHSSCTACSPALQPCCCWSQISCFVLTLETSRLTLVRLAMSELFV